MDKLGKGVTKVMDIWAKLLVIVGSVTLTIFFFAVLAQMFCRYLFVHFHRLPRRCRAGEGE